MAAAQQYDFVLRGGRVIDPGNGIDGRMDVAVSNGRIAAVQPDIPAAKARRALDVTGFYVVPGLVDLHAHVFGYEGSLVPDKTALPAATTTIVDAGGSGWRTFEEFRRTVIANSKTRVLALLNIVGKGMIGEPYESDTEDMDPVKTVDTISKNQDVIVGIKTAHFAKPGWIFGRPTFTHLDAGNSATRNYAAFLIKVPQNFAGVDRLLYRAGSIVVQERGNTGRELTMAAARLF